MTQQDCLRRFLFEEAGARGVWVRLQHSLQQAKQHQSLPNDAVDAQFGQALAAAVLLSATIKFKGALILQVQGGGDLRALVAQANNERKIRGLVRAQSTVNGATLREMAGDGGRLVLTVESDAGEPYQGIVAVAEESLAEVLTTYFRQSEQLDTRLWLFANRTHAAGLLVQALPGETADKADWERLEILAATVTAEELLSLECEEILHRLFHEEQVRLYEPETVAFECSCSRQKIAGTLFALGRSELEAILRERDDIEVDCQFCGAQYRYDRVDVEHLLNHSAADSGLPSPTRH